MKALLKEIGQYRCQKKQCYAAVERYVRQCKYTSEDCWLLPVLNTAPLAHIQKIINPKQNGYLPVQVQNQNFFKFRSHLVSVYSKQSIEKTHHSKTRVLVYAKFIYLHQTAFQPRALDSLG